MGCARYLQLARFLFVLGRVHSQTRRWIWMLTVSFFLFLPGTTHAIDVTTDSPIHRLEERLKHTSYALWWPFTGFRRNGADILPELRPPVHHRPGDASSHVVSELPWCNGSHALQKLSTTLLEILLHRNPTFIAAVPTSPKKKYTVCSRPPWHHYIHHWHSSSLN